LKDIVSKPTTNANELARVREDFISQWGAMGGAWGINRTMAQIHALLLVTEEPLSTDDVMARLEISRGNAHGNLRELVSWGLVRSVMIRGERREYFEAEKDIWTIFCIIARERKRREIDPAGTVLADCTRRAKAIPLPEAAVLAERMRKLSELLSILSGALEKVSTSGSSSMLHLLVKLLK
jgi:DNA-binding transcriptional regulator GbsR (MarR family)